MSNLLRKYTRIHALLHELDSNHNFLNQVRLPKLTDKQLIALNLAAEGLGIDSKRYLFKQLPDSLKPKIERSIYNRRRRSLAFKIKEFRQTIAHQVVAFSEHHIVDSMPVEVCKFSRANRSKICRDTVEQSSNHGYCAALEAYGEDGFMMESNVIRGVIEIAVFGDPVHINDNFEMPLSIYFYSTFMTSLWLRIYIFSVYLIAFSSRMRGLFGWLIKLSYIQDRPFMAADFSHLGMGVLYYHHRTNEHSEHSEPHSLG